MHEFEIPDTPAELLARTYQVPDTPRELLHAIDGDEIDEVERAFIEIGKCVSDVSFELSRYERNDLWLRKRIRELEVDNAELRNALFPFSDDEVFLALCRAYRGVPVAATAVAHELLATPVHSTRIRAGLALSRLAKAGRVVKFEPFDPSRDRFTATCRWSPR